MSTQIADTENALMGLLRECQLPAGVYIDTIGQDWDDGVIRRLVRRTPAVLLSFLGARPHASGAPSTSLNLLAEWAALVVIGWNGATQQDRRLAVDGGYDVIGRVAPILHHALIRDPQNNRLPFPEVVEIETVTDSALDVMNIWVAAIRIEVELPLDIPEDCVGPLDDFLRVRGDMEIADDPVEPVGIAVDLEQ